MSVDARVGARTHVAELTSREAGELGGGGRSTILLLPVGAVEPHGPHAPLGTDTIISEAICERTAAELADDAHARALVLPAVGYGVTRYSAAFPGALSISEATLESLVSDVCAASRARGLPVVIVNSHFEPEHVAALRRAASRTGAALFDLTRRANARLLTEEFRSGASHAGRYETSLILALQPHLVDVDEMRTLRPLHVDMPSAIAAGKTDFVAMGMDQAYCGAPAEASAEEGRATLATLSAMLAKLVREQVTT